ncbi:hypothetical protein BS47DRAFT_1341471 [Hydnum rufescens UP504]|uniref:Uncharacterized protein n=1 Tax=Hydnum rufescens UP504 TaxID=1448309 RepID=A0A9P6B1C5_9AGAM|nr:hypothetical protein BS47DRAFT_1341471 [Hydnum rufescens UP504]
MWVVIPADPLICFPSPSPSLLRIFSTPLCIHLALTRIITRLPGLQPGKRIDRRRLDRL